MKLDKATPAELRAALNYRRPGPKPGCECGKCKACRHRAKIARYRESQRLKNR